MKRVAEGRDDDGWGGECVCVWTKREQMKMRCRVKLYANFMTLPWVMTVTLFYHFTVSLFVSNLYSSPLSPFFSLFFFLLLSSSVSAVFLSPRICLSAIHSSILWEWANHIHPSYPCLCYGLQLLHPTDFLSGKPHNTYETSSFSVWWRSKQTHSCSYFSCFKISRVSESVVEADWFICQFLLSFQLVDNKKLQ